MIAGWPLGEAAAEAVRTRRPVGRVALRESDDLPPELAELGIRSAAWVPLSTGGSNRGLLILFRASGETFSAADLKMLETVAYRTSLSIEAGERQLMLERLARVGHRLARHLETDALLAETTELFRELTRAESVAIVGDEGGRLKMRGSSGLADDAPAGWPERTRELPCWDLAESGQACIVGDLAAGPEPSRLAVAGRAYLGVPIVREARTIGLLCAFHRVPGTFGEDAAELATIFASYVSAAMVNAELYLALAQSASKLQLMTDSISDMIALRSLRPLPLCLAVLQP